MVFFLEERRMVCRDGNGSGHGSQSKKGEVGKNRRVSAGDVESFQAPSNLSSRSARRVVSSGVLQSVQGMTLTEEPGETETLSEKESIDKDDLPGWAKRALFPDDPLVCFFFSFSFSWLMLLQGVHIPSYWLFKFSPIIFNPLFRRVHFSVHYHRDNSSVSRTIRAYGVLANHGAYQRGLYS